MPHEKKHRLALECYRGRIAVAFTACLRLQPPGAIDHETSELIRTKLHEAAAKYETTVLAWCLMPDHLHVILLGESKTADSWKAMVAFKQQTGFWLAQHRPLIVWQKDFYDHIIRSDESLEVQVRYIVENPVRAGLVAQWWQYPRTGGSMVNAMRAEIEREGAADAAAAG